jgi:hypothetical protein
MGLDFREIKPRFKAKLALRAYLAKEARRALRYWPNCIYQNLKRFLLSANELILGAGGTCGH